MAEPLTPWERFLLAMPLEDWLDMNEGFTCDWDCECCEPNSSTI